MLLMGGEGDRCGIWGNSERAEGLSYHWAMNQWYGHPPTLHLRSEQIKTKPTMILKTCILEVLYCLKHAMVKRTELTGFRGQGEGGPIESSNSLYTVIPRIDPRLVTCP